MVELCRSSFSDIIDKLKADLAYFKDDFQNKDMFEVIHKPSSKKTHPGTGHGASMPKTVRYTLGQPWNHHTERKPSMSNSSAFPKNHLSPTSKANTCSLTRVNPHWSTGKHPCATTTTSTLTKNDYIIQESASTTATTSTSTCFSTKTQWWVDMTNPLAKPIPK